MYLFCRGCTVTGLNWPIIVIHNIFCQYMHMMLQWLGNCKSRQNLLMTNHCVVLSAYTTLNRLWILYVNQERPINLCWCRRYFVQFDVIYWSALIYCRPLPPVLCCENGLRKKRSIVNRNACVSFPRFTFLVIHTIHLQPRSKSFILFSKFLVQNSLFPIKALGLVNR